MQLKIKALLKRIKRPKNQMEDVYNLLKNNYRITQMMALEVGVMRLSERVRELEAIGFVIKHIPKFVHGRRGSVRVMSYQLVGKFI